MGYVLSQEITIIGTDNFFKYMNKENTPIILNNKELFSEMLEVSNYFEDMIYRNSLIKQCPICKKIFEVKTANHRICSNLNCKRLARILYNKKKKEDKLIIHIWAEKRRLKKSKVFDVYNLEELKEKQKSCKGFCLGYGRERHYVGTDKLTIDHIIPISKATEGFKYSINDIQFLCKGCNTRKLNHLFISAIKLNSLLPEPIQMHRIF